jgi:hypothetical protein
METYITHTYIHTDGDTRHHTSLHPQSGKPPDKKGECSSIRFDGCVENHSTRDMSATVISTTPSGCPPRTKMVPQMTVVAAVFSEMF